MMKSPFWFAVTIILCVVFASAAIDWLFQPQVVQAAAGEAITAVQTSAPVQSTAHTSPVVQAAVAVVVVLFGSLALMPLFEEKDRGSDKKMGEMNAGVW